MISVFLAPLYILWNAVQLYWILRWLKACQPVFQALWIKIPIIVLYILLASSLLVAFFLPSSELKRWFKLISNYWLGVLLYMTLVIGGMIVVRLILKHVNFRCKQLLFSRSGLAICGAVCAVIIILLSVWGMVNARHIRITEYEVEINKSLGGAEADSQDSALRIALVADLHLGYNISNDSMRNMVERINLENPDLVVIAGDIFDNEYEALEDPDELAVILSGLKSKYGTFACYGNHDIQEPVLAGFTFSSDKKKESDIRMDELLEKAGIRLMRDEGVLVADSFYVYGRPDSQRPGRGISVRKTPAEITADMDQKKPIIVIDHQPRELDELAEAGVDLDLCGHTHDGQLFPGNLLVSFLWENSCGYLKKGNMHNIVTSGVGVFGPFMRVGTKSEICMINVYTE